MPVRLVDRWEKEAPGHVLVKVSWNRLPGWRDNPAYNLGFKVATFSEYRPDAHDLEVLEALHWKDVPVRVFVQPDGKVGIDGVGTL